MPAGGWSNRNPPPALDGLLRQLPNRWSREARDAFVEVFSKVLDVCILIVEPKDEPTQDDAPKDDEA